MNRQHFQILIAISIIFLGAFKVAAHCEIPCGIYDDSARVQMISEHIMTIEKSMKEIMELQDTKPLNSNQITRWIMNKEKHATEIQNIVSQYFMTQRINPDSENYEKKLAALHKMLISAMKCKQTTDLANVTVLRNLLDRFCDLYFGETKKER